MSADNFTHKLLDAHIFIARTITQANAIENIIDAYIADYYTRCPDGDYKAPYLAFRHDILTNRNVTLSAKVDFLFKVFKRVNPSNATKAHRKKYTAWLEIRNKFAHGNHIGDEDGGRLLYGGELFDIKELADQFTAYQQQILSHLELYKELRGPYFNHIPTKEWEDKK